MSWLWNMSYLDKNKVLGQIEIETFDIVCN